MNDISLKAFPSDDVNDFHEIAVVELFSLWTLDTLSNLTSSLQIPVVPIYMPLPEIDHLPRKFFRKKRRYVYAVAKRKLGQLNRNSVARFSIIG